MNISAILLAAGSSSRMGQSKQLLPIGNNTILKNITQTVLASSVSNVLVVLGANALEHQHAIEELPVSIIINKDWEKGMGSSIKAGLQYSLDSDYKPDAIIILVCDQVMLTSDHINSIVGKFKKSTHSIIASEYANTLGVPALFPNSLFDRIMKLKDEQGARIIINEFQESVCAVSFLGGEIDLDTPADYQTFLARNSESSRK